MDLPLHLNDKSLPYLPCRDGYRVDNGASKKLFMEWESSSGLPKEQRRAETLHICPLI